jgi:uncharacterized membrane protein
MMWDYNDSWMHGFDFGGWFMFLGLIAIIVAVVFVVVYLARLTTSQAGAAGQGTQGGVTDTVTPSAQSPAPETPRDIVKQRYASGEIEREEYLQKLADLGG